MQATFCYDILSVSYVGRSSSQHARHSLSPKGIVNKSLQPFTLKHTIENYFKMRNSVLDCCALEIDLQFCGTVIVELGYSNNQEYT